MATPLQKAIRIQPGLQVKLSVIFKVCPKKNIEKCNAMRRRQRRRTVKNNIWSNQQKRNFARSGHFFCTFVCRCFARLQCETSRNFFVTRFLGEMSYMFSFTFFFTAAHFHLALVPLAFLILSPLLQSFHVVLPTKKYLLCFFFSLSFAVFQLYIPNLWT